MAVKASLAGKVAILFFLGGIHNFFYIFVARRGCWGKTSRQQRHSSGNRQPGQVKWKHEYKQCWGYLGFLDTATKYQ